MKNFLLSAIILIAFTLLIIGVVALGGWIVATFLNVVLVGIGLQKITTFGAICLIVAMRIIYKMITF